MSSVSSTGSYFDSLNSSSSTSTTEDRFNDLTMSDFITMMVAELENQDPMNPMSNTEMLSQINQMRQITSNDKLSTSIEALTLGQSLSTASSMIGKEITGVNSLGAEITGTVDKVTIEDGVAKLYVGNSIVEIANVTAIKDASSKTSSSDTDKSDTESDTNKTEDAAAA